VIGLYVTQLIDPHGPYGYMYIAKRTCVKESTIVIANTNKIFQRFTSLCQFVSEGLHFTSLCQFVSEGLHFIRLHDGIISLREFI